MSNSNKDRQWAVLIGLGLALLPIHNKFLTDLTTNSKGETIIFIPAFGYLLLIMGTGLFLVDNWRRIRQAGWGDTRVTIPLAVIALSMIISGFTTGIGIEQKVAPLGMAVSLLALYTASRILSSAIFRPLIPLVILGTVTAIVLEIVDPDNLSGGLITNSCAAAGFLVFGALTNRVGKQWILCLAATIGVLVTGNLEGLFIVMVLGVTAILRRDFGRGFWIVASGAALIIVTGTVLGYLKPIHAGTTNLSTLWSVVAGKLPLNTATLDAITTGRWTINTDVLRNTAFLGHGFTLSVERTTAHNTILIILDQIGIPAAIAWVYVTLYCLFRTGWKYLWIAVLAVSVFDHFLWTQFLPYWWCFVGASTLPNEIIPDLIFRQTKKETIQYEQTT